MASNPLPGGIIFQKGPKKHVFFILHFIFNFKILICLKHELKEGSSSWKFISGNHRDSLKNVTLVNMQSELKVDMYVIDNVEFTGLKTNFVSIKILNYNN